MRTTRARHASSARPKLSLRSKVARYVAALVALPLAVTGLVTVAQPAGAAGGVAATRYAGSGFPTWYADAAGHRVEPCLDSGDASCILPAAGDEPNYDPALPLAFPTNFPSEFFYAYAASDTIATPGCQGTAPGKASIVLAVEGAFINGAPAAGDQMVFGRTRVRVSSGLCPNALYTFKHPMGSTQIRADSAGAVTAVLGTEDVGCVPGPGLPCNFQTATQSRVFGVADDGGFLRWTADPALAPGYLGDGATPHTVTGGQNDNTFSIADNAGTVLPDGNGGTLSTNLFTVSGKLAGPLFADPADFGGVVVGTTAARTMTVTNIGSAAVTIHPGGVTVLGAPSQFAVTGGTCVSDTDVDLDVDATCTVDLSFTPDGFPPVSDLVTIASTGVRPLSVRVAGTGINDGDAPTITPIDPVDFGEVRVKQEKSLDVTVTNGGTAPLRVSGLVFTNSGEGSSSSDFHIAADTCRTAEQTVPVGGSCTVTVTMRPISRGVHHATLAVLSNVDGGETRVALTGEGIGGGAAVSADVDPYDGFPYWYRDDNSVKLSQCIDPADPYCVVLPDGGYDPAQPQEFPTNFPGEYFYTVADSEPLTTPGCDGGPEGLAFIRSAVEGTFVNGVAAFGDQMVFGRVRIVVRGGLCPDTDYTFTHPYGETTLHTNADGSIKPVQGTVDIGCVPAPGETCVWDQALSSPVFGGFLRWDPAVAPAAPAGYIGDAVTFHSVIGAPYRVGGTPANYFRISGPGIAEPLETNQFTVMGKLRGPFEATGGVTDKGHVDFGGVAVGSSSGSRTVTFTNTGATSLTVDPSAVAVTGADAADFTVGSDQCSNQTLAPGDTCTVAVGFSPSATGARSATLEVTHSGLNSPAPVVLDGIGSAGTGLPAFSFAPRSVTWPQLAVDGVGATETVTISNVGGDADLNVASVAIGAEAPNDFAVLDEDCVGTPVPAGKTCSVQVVFTPTQPGAIAGSLVVVADAPTADTEHRLALTGTASAAGTAVSAATDPSGFPRYYQDANGVRLEPCLDTNGKCVVLPDATYKATAPLVFPSNFPGEFFYAVADSDIVPLDGCGGQTEPGTALLRVGLEGTFADGTPSFNDQMTFTRIRFTATSGLCPNVDYQWVSPYGAFVFRTDANGGLARNAGTIDIGCGAVVGGPACDFSEALASPVPLGTNGVPANTPAAKLPRTPIDGFLRWDPNVGLPAPAGYLGDAASLHKVVGGTYRPKETEGPVNSFQIRDLADNTIAGTDLWTVAGKTAGPLYADQTSVAFGHQRIGTHSGTKVVTVHNATQSPVTVEVSKGSLHPDQFTVVSLGDCAAVLPADGSCDLSVQFDPTGDTAGARKATLLLRAAGDPAARTVSVTLDGLADPVGVPAVNVAPGVLSFGTITAPGTLDKTTVVTNTGTGVLKFTAPATVTGAGSGDYQIVTNTCTADVEPAGVDVNGDPTPAGTCSVTVRFTPKANGARVGTLTLFHNATGGQTVISLSGTGLGSTFSVSPNPVGFSKVTVNTTKSSSLSVKNTGTIAFRITGAVVNSATAGIFGTTPGTCVNQVIQPGRSCSMNVTFRPTVSGANYSGTLVLTGDGTSLPASVSVAVTGQGK